MSSERGWKVAVAGECMLTRTFREHNEPEFLKIKEIMDQADVGYGHLEVVLGEFNRLHPVRGNFIGTFLLADPKVAEDLHWMGIDMMSLAHNHSFDYGEDGIHSTMSACREANIAGAGIGCDLEEAREPAYWESGAGRFALISASSGNASYDWANLPKGGMAARSGMNPLNAKIRFHLPAEDAKMLRAVGEKLEILREKNSKVPNGLEDGEFRFYIPSENSTVGNQSFVEDDDYFVDSVCDPYDLKENLRSIESATNVADLVMVAHHATVYEKMSKKEPTTYAREFAHAAIDAGADVFFGHGWHKMLGIEIYRGKPIFYGLGNMFAQSQFSRRVPYDGYKTWGHDIDRLPTLMPTDSPLRPGMKPSQSLSWWSSTLMELDFAPDKTIREITFYPVELGIDPAGEGYPVNRYTGRYAEGRPRIASGEGAQVILRELQRLCRPYGTEIEICGDIARWKA